MRTYLGAPVRVWLGWAVAAALLSGAAVGAGLTPQPPECGYVWEEGQWMEAGCSTVEDLEERLESIRHSRSGQREWGRD